MLTQRLGRSANSMITGETANAEIALTLGRDISLFRDLTQALLAGSDRHVHGTVMAARFWVSQVGQALGLGGGP